MTLFENFARRPVDCDRVTRAPNAAATGTQHLPWWLWLNVLGLDAPLLAVLWQALLAWSFHAALGAAESILLGLACWFVYAADYLLDGSRAPDVALLAPRHAFYFEHKKQVLILMFITAITMVLVAAIYLDRSVSQYGVAISVLSAAYFAFLHLSPEGRRSRWPRELAVAVLFTCGTFVAAWARLGGLRYRLIPSALVFATLCWMNTAAIEFWEWQKNGFGPRRAPSSSAQWLAVHLREAAILVACGAIWLARISAIPWGFAVAAALSGLSLSLLGARARACSANFVRIAADVALYTPLAVFSLNGFR